MQTPKQVYEHLVTEPYVGWPYYPWPYCPVIIVVSEDIRCLAHNPRNAMMVSSFATRTSQDLLTVAQSHDDEYRRVRRYVP